VKVGLWDWSWHYWNQPEFRMWYLKGASGVFLVHNFLDRQFHVLQKDVESLREECPDDTVIVLIGNSVDEVPDLGFRELVERDWHEFAAQHSVLYFATSALTDDGVEEAFLGMLGELRRRHPEKVEYMNTGLCPYPPNLCAAFCS
jgi:GTPase SAR1 family protein